MEISNPHLESLKDRLNHYGSSLTTYEQSVINLIASDSARCKQFTDTPPYAGHMIQEGLLEKRPFAGALLHDQIEALASEAACQIFQADHANLQPHSCSQANQAVYHALLQPGDAVLALGFKAGGHLTHGLKLNFSGRSYHFSFYGLGENDLIDYDEAHRLAKTLLPKLIICGSSAYPGLFDAPRLRAIADSVGARLMFDLSHEAGLIAAAVIPNPIPLADVATMSLDKTLRGPFGGAIMCRKELVSVIDKAVHPGTQSSFSVRSISDKAHALILSQEADFIRYARSVLGNAKALAQCFSNFPNILLTGGTEKHYIILDVQKHFSLSGEMAEQRLEEVNILSSRQTLPYDKSAKMSEASGIRLGTAWATSRGYEEDDFQLLGKIIIATLSSKGDKETLRHLAGQVRQLVRRQRPNDVWA